MVDHFRLLILFILFTVQRSLTEGNDLEDDPHISYIKRLVLAFDEKYFEKDPIVVRSDTKFKNPIGFRNHSTVFTQNSSSLQEQEVIVLTGHEDYIRRSGLPDTNQRVFVTLRRKRATLDNYYVNYVYSRNVFEGETEVDFEFEGSRRRFEFDAWDRRGADNNLETRMGWSVCSKSFFISCAGDPSALVSYDSGDEPDYPDELTEMGIVPSTSDDTILPKDAQIQPDNEQIPEQSVEYLHDFFTDLADEFTQSWFVGSALLLASNGVFGINTQVRFISTDELKNIAREKRETREYVQPLQPQDQPRIERSVSYTIGPAGGGVGPGTYNVQRRYPLRTTPYVPSREELTLCLKDLSRRNVGGRGDGLLDKVTYGVEKSLNYIAGDGSKVEDPLKKDVGGRGRQGDQEDPEGGILQPLNTVGKFLSTFSGFLPGMSSNRSAGTAYMNGLRVGSDISLGWTEGVGDTLGQVLGVGKVSKDRSHLDSIGEDLLYGIFSLPGIPLDIVDSIAKPLGLSPLLSKVAGTLSTLVAGIAGFVVSPVTLATNLVKVGAKALGVGGLLGMHGNSDNAGVQHCINQLGLIKRLRDAEVAKQLQNLGRSFNSKPVNLNSVIRKGDRAGVDLFTPFGWRGLHFHRNEPFVGFGYCDTNDNLTLADLNKLKTGAEAADFYLKTLRTDCNVEQKKQFLHLISTKILQFDPATKTFAIIQSHPVRQDLKLTPADAASFSQAFEIQEYSKAYVAEFKQPTPILRNPDNLVIYRSVNTLRRMAFSVFCAAHHQFPLHSVKLVRNLIVTLKSALIKLFQSLHIVNICPSCLFSEASAVGNSAIAIISVIDFIMQKYEPDGQVDKIMEADLIESYNDFYLANRQKFANRLATYFLAPVGQLNIADVSEYGPNVNVSFVEVSV